jgi:hypothetical protein
MVNNDFELSKIEKKALRLEKKLEKSKLTAPEIFDHLQILPPAFVCKQMKISLAKYPAPAKPELPKLSSTKSV